MQDDQAYGVAADELRHYKLFYDHLSAIPPQA